MTEPIKNRGEFIYISQYIPFARSCEWTTFECAQVYPIHIGKGALVLYQKIINIKINVFRTYR